MKVIQVKNNKFIDQELFDYINQIWLNFDIEIADNSAIFYGKNTTVNKLITDYSGKGIYKVLQPDKAEYFIINKFSIRNFAQYFDGINIIEDDTKEVVYGIYNNSAEVQSTIELICTLKSLNKDIKFVNQDRLNESLNNGFIITNDNYHTIKELIDSEHVDNHKLACAMMIASDLKNNWEWLLYLYHEKDTKFGTYDVKNVINNYINSLSLGYANQDLFNKVDTALCKITNPDVKEKFVLMIRDNFQKHINGYFINTLKTSKFVLNDFKIDYNG